ncbi:MAG: phosphoribosylaminoimidazolesuccinocarboxamide synthase [Candidatus Roizmanbacteria bacterium]|nr:MAG: phosphoribosylaminoimidazolesuccinocarboxamide synthase [Candidatus Roizmanbacteria bacterium]
MVQSKTILKALPHVLKEIDLSFIGPKKQGKVRDYCAKDYQRIQVTTDRQSAFDVNLGFIPFKGTVLNQLSAFWFNKTKKIVDNYMVAIPHPNVIIGAECQSIPVEMIVRGYLSGSTKTSVWTAYEKGERLIYGLKFPEGMKKNQKLSTPILTPTTHGSGPGGHDEKLTRDEIIKRGIVPKKLYEEMEKATLELFEFGSKWCKKQGLILVDTKYEFGLYNGKLTLIDEIHTPDSSRFWIAKTYKERLKKGLEPENFDKEFLRLWYVKRGYSGDGIPPKMSKDLIVDLAQRYIGVYEKITGQKFQAYEYPIEEKIKKSLEKYFAKK